MYEKKTTLPNAQVALSFESITKVHEQYKTSATGTHPGRRPLP
jgi:hypothetical protein